MTKQKSPMASISQTSWDEGSKRSVPSRRSVYLSLAVLLGLSLLICHALERIDLSLERKEQRETTLREVALLSSRIEKEVNSTFYLIAGLARLIEINGEITRQQFDEICSALIRSRPGLVNIAAAPDMVIRYVYPLQSNEAVLGLDYAKTPAQREAAFRAKESGQPVIAGPVALVQGGEAVIGRFPVYVRHPDTQAREFWGILSTPFDTAVLYQEAGLLDPSLVCRSACADKTHSVRQVMSFLALAHSMPKTRSISPSIFSPVPGKWPLCPVVAGCSAHPTPLIFV